jgi:hypothetical protein
MSGSAATGGRKSATTEAIAQWAVATATIATTAQWAEAQEWTVKATLIAGIAIWGALNGHGPFVRPSPNESLLLLQAFVCVIGVTTLAIAARHESLTKAADSAE